MARRRVERVATWAFAAVVRHDTYREMTVQGLARVARYNFGCAEWVVQPLVRCCRRSSNSRCRRLIPSTKEPAGGTLKEVARCIVDSTLDVAAAVRRVADTSYWEVVAVEPLHHYRMAGWDMVVRVAVVAVVAVVADTVPEVERCIVAVGQTHACRTVHTMAAVLVDSLDHSKIAVAHKGLGFQCRSSHCLWHLVVHLTGYWGIGSRRAAD